MSECAAAAPSGSVVRETLPEALVCGVVAGANLSAGVAATSVLVGVTAVGVVSVATCAGLLVMVVGEADGTAMVVAFVPTTTVEESEKNYNK